MGGRAFTWFRPLTCGTSSHFGFIKLRVVFPLSSLCSFFLLLLFPLYSLGRPTVTSPPSAWFCRNPLPVKKGVLPSHCHQAISHGRSSDCRGFLSNIVGSLCYNRTCPELSFVVNWHYINKLNELNLTQLNLVKIYEEIVLNKSLGFFFGGHECLQSILYITTSILCM